MSEFTDRVNRRYTAEIGRLRQAETQRAQEEKQLARQANIADAQAKSAQYAQEAQNAVPGWLEVAGSVAGGITKPITGVLEAPAIAAKGLYKGVTGQGYDFSPVWRPEMPELETYYQKSERITGDIVEGKKSPTAMLGVMAEPIVDVVTLAYTPAKALQSIRGGKYLHAAAVGGISTAPYGAIEAVQEDQGMWKAAKKTALYGAIGAAAGLGFAGAGTALSKAAGTVSKRFRKPEEILQTIQNTGELKETDDAVAFLASRPDVNIGTMPFNDTPAGRAVSQIEKNYDDGTMTIMIDPKTTDDGVMNQAAAYYLATKTDLTPAIQKEIASVGDAGSVQDGLSIAYRKLIEGDVKPEEIPNIAKIARDNGMVVGEQKVVNNHAELMNVYRENKTKVEDAFFKVASELEYAQAGQRIFNDYASDLEIIGVGSTFPKWVPEHLRDKKLFDKVLGFIKDYDQIEIPRGSRQKELMNTVLDRVDSLSDIDTKQLRYEQPTGTIDSSVRGSKTGDGTGTTSGEKVDSTKKTQPTEEGKKVSSSRERIAEMFNLDMETTYDVRGINREADKATQLIEKDGQEAYNIAMGGGDDLVQKQATNIMLSQKAFEQGDAKALSELTNQRFLTNTAIGQALNMEKLSIRNSPHEKYMKELFNTRMQSNIKFSSFKDAGEMATKKVKSIANKVKQEVTQRAQKMINAQSILDSITC